MSIEIRRGDSFGWVARFYWPHSVMYGREDYYEEDYYEHPALTRRGAIRKAQRRFYRLRKIQERRNGWEPIE